MPFSTLGMNWVGTDPPTTLDSNSKPEPRGNGLNSTWHTAYWPWPPDCFTCRPVTRAGCGDGLPHRHPDRLGVHLGAAGAQPGEHHVGVRLAHAPEHGLVGLLVALQAQRRVGGDQLGQRLDQRVLVAAGVRVTATGSSGSGRFQQDSSSGWSDADTVSPVSAVPSLVSAQMSPATHSSTSRRVAPSGL